MVIGHAIQVFNIPSMYRLHWIVLIPYNFLAVRYGIQYPMIRKQDISWKKAFWPLLISTTIFDMILLRFVNASPESFLVLLIAHIVEFILMKPKYEKNQDMIQRNIENYYRKKD